MWPGGPGPTVDPSDVQRPRRPQMTIHIQRRARRAAIAVAAAAAALSPAPSAFAAPVAVYGGSTKAGDAIVIRADAAAKQLKSVVIATDARCSDGMGFPLSSVLTA